MRQVGAAIIRRRTIVAHLLGIADVSVSVHRMFREGEDGLQRVLPVGGMVINLEYEGRMFRKGEGLQNMTAADGTEADFQFDIMMFGKREGLWNMMPADGTEGDSQLVALLPILQMPSSGKAAEGIPITNLCATGRDVARIQRRICVTTMEWVGDRVHL